MSEMTDFMDYEDIEDGVYEYGKFDLKTEAVSYDKTVSTRLYMTNIRMPMTPGNIVYLLSDSFESGLNLSGSRAILFPSTYRQLFYPLYYAGSYFGKRVMIKNAQKRNERNNLIKTKSKFTPYPSRNILAQKKKNVVFETSDIFEAFSKWNKVIPARKILYGFFTEYKRIIDSMTPDVFTNKICVIDASKFTFKIGSSLEKNKNNPLFILYFALFKTKDNSILNVDMDFLITSDRMFMKFNPAHITPQTFSKFKMGLFRIVNANLDEYLDSLSKEEQDEITITDNDSVSKSTIDKVTNAYTVYNSPEVKNSLSLSVADKIKNDVSQKQATDKVIKNTVKEVSINKSNITSNMSSTKSPITFQQPSSSAIVIKRLEDQKRSRLFKSVMGDLYQPLYSEEDGEEENIIDITSNEDDVEDIRDPDDIEAFDDDVSDYVSRETINIINNDKDMAEQLDDEIQERKAPLKSERNSPINSARDQKLREAQKKVTVKDSTIEEILEKDSSNVLIKVDDHSDVMHTSNENMKTIAFNNFDKTYIDEVYTHDILGCFSCLADKSVPLYIAGVSIEDTSDALNLKETWTVKLVDSDKKRFTITVDIPKFYEDRFMYIKSNKKMILKQNVFMPIVKDSPDTVIITTNLNKITIQRKDTKSFSDIERLFSLMKKIPTTENPFTAGSSTDVNKKFISVLEYDEISKSIFSFKSDSCSLYFNREYIRDNIDPLDDIKGNEFLIGFEGKIPVVINEDTGLDRLGRNIITIIRENLSETHRAQFDSIKAGTRSIVAEGKLLGEFIPVIITLTIWNGFKTTLDHMGIKWEFIHGTKKPERKSGMRYIRFHDGFLEYEDSLFSQLMMNGLTRIKPELFTFDEMDTEKCYIEYLHSIFGNYSIKNSFQNFNEFLMDHITIEVCRDMSLPTNSTDLLIHAVKLLADNSYLNKASDKMFRTRSIETIPSILYSVIASQYQRYTNSGGKEPMTIPRDIVIKQLLTVKTVEDYSTINPATEVGKMSTISAKGISGSNKDTSYDEKKRSYDPSSIGKLAMGTSNDANVGINRELVIEPTITNVRGYRKPVDDINELKDVNIFSAVELLTPGTVRNDDPVRSTIAGKQTKHVIPTNESSPALISNGYDEAIQFHLSSDFVVNAKDNGKVVEVNDELGFIIVKYDSGESQAINIKPTIVKNGGGGFYLSNTLKANVKLNEKFKKDYPLAYHDKYFTNSKMNGLRHNVGPLVKMAFLSSADTYEDAGICTEKLSKMIATDIVYRHEINLSRNNNIVSIANIGDTVKVGDNLVKFDTAYEDNDIIKFLSNLSDDEKDVVVDTTRNALVARNAGEIVDIKVYSLLDPSNLSPTLGDVVQQFFTKGEAKKELLNKYDSSPGILKAGYLLTDNTEPVISRYGEIKGTKTDVLIEFYIKKADYAGIGDKIVLYGPNKQIISKMIPEGYEPFAESRPNEEISVITSPGTVARRMVTSVLPIAATMKIMVELKRKVEDMMK